MHSSSSRGITSLRAGTAAAALLFVILLPFLASCGGGKEHKSAPLATHRVRVASVKAEDRPRMTPAVGTVRSEHEAVVSSKVMGAVLEVRVGAGDTVRRGQTLIVVDARDVAGQIAQAEGALAQARAAAVLAETNFRRFEQLQQKGSASQLELDQARFQYESTKGAVIQAEGALASASSYRSYAEIAAPFDGCVAERMVEVGDMAAPGRPLLRLEDSGRMRCEATLPEAAVGRARLGETVEVTVPALGDRVFPGVVSEISPALDQGTRSTLIKIRLPQDPELRSGLYARAAFPGAMESAIRIPAEALVRRGGMTGVVLSDGGKARFRLITVDEDGGHTGPGAEVVVLAGLSGGEQVVLSPPALLEEGSPLEAAGVDGSAAGAGSEPQAREVNHD